MKRISLLLLGAAIIGCNTTQTAVADKQKAPADPIIYANSITEKDLSDHLYTYASDEFEGRETGKPGQKKAVEYIKAHYMKLGIPAAKADGDYFQKVPLEMSAMPESKLMLNGNTYTLGEDYFTFSGPAGENYSFNNVVFAGYGIEDEGYSDYANLDVKGKVVLVKSGEPKDENGNYVISGSTEKSKWSNLRTAFSGKLGIAQDKGAAAVLIYDVENLPVFKQQYNFMKGRGGSISLKGGDKNDFFYAVINDKIAKDLYADIDNATKASTVNTAFSITFKNNNTDVDSENVVAVIKGSEKPNEYVVVSSHLDHIGVSKDGQINNGADDDGSGTVATLEIAEAFKKAADAGHGPKRSVVFLHVTGEEKGLLGSKYYTDEDPIFPLANTVANLNIDMVGRIDPKREGDRNYIYLIGADKLSTELHNLSEEVNSKYCNIELDYKYNDENDPNRFYYRSDHYNFAKNNIPIIFYFNGTHDDYHRPGDTPDKINYDLLENRTRLVFHTAWELANRENRIVVDKATK
jgi:hypothetical protein